MNCDVGIIGAGAAGLTAAAELAACGMKVRVLEAGTRAGGRIWTMHDPSLPLPVELGAEFIHGRPPELWRYVRDGALAAFEHNSQAVHLIRGRKAAQTGVGEIAERVLARLSRSAPHRDESFAEYLRRSRAAPHQKQWARIHVEGFNAADAGRIGIASLAQDSVAADRIDGDRSFRFLAGYDTLTERLLGEIPDWRAVVRLQCLVTRVRWQHGNVEVSYRSGIDGPEASLHCRFLIVTVPLGVLQAVPPARGAIEFDPEPRASLAAARSLAMGQVYRVTFRFSEPFWESDAGLRGAGFLISNDAQFFAWWTTHPIVSPLLTGWMAGSAADRFRLEDPPEIAAAACRSLSRILSGRIPKPEAFYFHNWRTDPHFRGAYSYTPAGQLPARRMLARPVENTLFFAGEAVETGGHSATVHGAIATGRRAARLVRKAAVGE